MERRCSSHAVVGLVAILQVSCGGTQPGAPPSMSSSPLSLTGTVTLGDVASAVQWTLYSTSQNVTNSATWQSSNTAVATVSSGLVRATGLGTATISATYQQQTASAMVSVAADQDCDPYDSTHLALVQETQDVPPSWTVTAPIPGGAIELLASADNTVDANKLLALFQRYTQYCFIGRGNTRPNRQQYMVTYFKGVSGQPTTISPEDCVGYNPSALQVVNQGALGWAVTSGGTELALLDTQFEAGLVSAVASQYSNECYIGRGNARQNPYRYINEYWK